MGRHSRKHRKLAQAQEKRKLRWPNTPDTPSPRSPSPWRSPSPLPNPPRHLLQRWVLPPLSHREIAYAHYEKHFLKLLYRWKIVRWLEIVRWKNFCAVVEHCNTRHGRWRRRLCNKGLLSAMARDGVRRLIGCFLSRYLLSCSSSWSSPLTSAWPSEYEKFLMRILNE